MRGISRTTVVLPLLASLAWTAVARCEPVAPTREDIAHSYLLFEQSVDKYPPPRDLAEFNVEFDWVTRLIFRRRWDRAASEVAALTDRLLPAELRTPAERSARGTTVRPFPAVATPGSEVTLTFAPLFHVEQRPSSLQVLIRDDERVVFRDDFDPAGDTLTWTAAEAVGFYTVDLLATPGSSAWTRASISIVADAPKSVRQTLLKQLDAVVPDEALQPAASALRARLNLLLEQDDPARPRSFVGNAADLVEDLTTEVAALAAGEDPYAGKVGTYWTTLAGIPAVVHVPEWAVKKGRPLPVIFALHGAGGDENLFVLGYGAGKLKGLADKHGFVLVSPHTYPLLGRGDLLAAMMEEMSNRYELDQDRVYAIGHSLGAITIAGWTLSDADGPANDVLAGVGLIAGGGMTKPVTRAVPMFVAAAGHDRIFKPDRLEAMTQAVRKLGLAAEFKLYDDEAHVSIVRRSLDDVVGWLLQQRRS